jgi:hypothetical protein
MRFYFYFLLLFGLAPSISGFAQDTIIFLNGDIAYGKLIETNDISTTYTIQKGKKTKTKVKETINIFGIIDSGGTLDTLYTPIEEQDLTLSPNEMYLFILGEQDAKQYFHPKWTIAGGLVFGAGLGYLLHDGFYVASVPLVYTIGAGVSTVKVNNLGNRPTNVLIQPAYQEGFIKVARAKKSFYALGSSVVGTLIGALIGRSQD